LAVNIVHNLEKVVKADGITAPKQSAVCTYDVERLKAFRGLK